MAVIDQEITDRYAIYNGDSCEVLPSLPDGSVHLSVYSPPFAAEGGGCLYHYSSSERDLSNCRTYEEFFEHYRFIVQELFRLTMKGRLSAVHCNDIARHGDKGMIDLPGDIIRLHMDCGWHFWCRHHVWKEPLGVRNRTMAKGLAHRQVVQDSSLCDAAAADQLLLFRKPGENPVPIEHPHGLLRYAGERQMPADLRHYKGWDGMQRENRYSHWIWRQYACYSADTEVLTRMGWKLHCDVSTEDEVCCFNLATEGQEWHRPSHVHAAEYDGDMVNINGGTKAPLDVMVTPNHRMVVQPGYPLPRGTRKPHKNPRHWAFREAGTMATSKWLLPYAIGADETGEGGDAVFARFLGWWLSEGSIAYGAPVLTQTIGRTAERMRETVAELGYEANCIVQDDAARQRKPCMHLRLKSALDLGRWLRTQCGSGARQKRIPADAFLWSSTVRRALLDALIDGDGTRHTEDRWSYCTTSSRLADDVQRLAVSLGFSGRMMKRKGTNEKRAPYTYYVHIGDRKYVTVQPRNFASVPYKGIVYCLTVPTGAYMTRRNGRMAVAGNSSFWDDVRLERTLPYKEAKEDRDERHMHPLQLDVIERIVVLRSNVGETVLSPFMGVGSEVYGALINGRRGVGVELKESYYRQAVRNVRAACEVGLEHDLLGRVVADEV